MKIFNRTSYVYMTYLLLLIFVLGTFGCAKRETEQYYDLRRTQIEIEKTAKSINNSLIELSGMEHANRPKPASPNIIDAVSTGLAQPLTLDWNGPVDQLIEKIAQIVKYKFKILGRKPALPIIVAIAVNNVQTSDIIRDLNFQCGERANINIFPSSRIIELRYIRI